MQPMRRSSWHAFLAPLLAVVLLVGACGDDDESGVAATSDDESALEDTVRATVRAEQAKDVDAFLDLWTDEGLEEYDVGTREEVRSGESPLGEDEVEIVGFTDTSVTGDAGTTTVDAVVGDGKVAQALFRVKFRGLKVAGKWKLNGFEFVGSPPPGASAAVIDIKALEYAYQLSAGEAPGDLAIAFSNTGQEPHEISMFKGPDGVSLDTAKAALEKVDGSSLDNLPAGYEADHITFAEPGQSADVTFAEPLARGAYVLACFIPAGGFTEEGDPVKPEAQPHIQLGMISLLTVT